MLNYVEYYSVIKQKKGIRNQLNNYLFDRLTYRLSDGVIPISSFIEEQLNRKKYSKPSLRIPIVCDVKRFSKERSKQSGNYFCYCGSSNYLDVILFVIKAYEEIKVKRDFFLYLIISGDERKKKVVVDYINKNEKLRRVVKIFSNLSDARLEEMYINAKALLIPLRDTIQDNARFPHKIGEYTATGNPMISTNIGEVKSYFKNNVNALLADKYNEKAFSEKMSFVIESPTESRFIGQEGKAICDKSFNYKCYRKQLTEFLNKIAS